MPCDCLEEMQKATKESGVWIGQTFVSPCRALLDTSWWPGFKPKRGQRVPTLIANYCPFCGVRYEEKEHGTSGVRPERTEPPLDRPGESESVLQCGVSEDGSGPGSV